MNPQIQRIVSMPFDENTYVLHLQGRADCVVVDPGLEPQKIIEYLVSRELLPAAIVCTHGHSDHIAGNHALKSRWSDCPIVIGAGDAWKLSDPVGNLSAQFGFRIVSPPAEVELREGDTYESAGMAFQVLETPGHSAGHIVLVLQRDRQTWVLGGDVLFREGIGRTDFPDGSFEDLEASIHKKLFTLPDDAIVLPGHGPETTIGFEKRRNPWVGEPAGYRPHPE